MAGNNPVTVRTYPHASPKAKAAKDLQTEQALIMNALGTPPESFDETKSYKVWLSASVNVPGTDVWLRPSDSVVVISGATANAIKTSIFKASAIEE